MRKLAAILMVAVLAATAQGGALMRWGRNYVVIYPSADGTVTNWTKSTANYYQAVSEAADSSGQTNGDGDTTYMDAPHNLNCSAIFDLTNSAAYATANTKIRFVSFIAEGKKVTDSGSGGANNTLNVYLRIAGVNYAMSSQSVTSSVSYTKWSAIGGTNVSRAYVNPATSLPWTASDLDALQIEIDKTATTARWDLRITAVAIAVAYDRVFDTLPATRIHGAGN